MPAAPKPCATITLDDLATIAAQIAPLTRRARPGNTRDTARIEAIFRRYGIAFTDAPTTSGEPPCG